MIGPYTLTHIVYVLLVIAFIAVISYMVYYNLRVKARQRQLNHGGEVHNTPGSITAATESLEDDERRNNRK